jgi:hypothetical protein
MSFNAEAFKASAVSDVNADRFTPIPEGEYRGVITKTDVAAGESARGPWARYDVTVEVTDPQTQELRSVRGGLMLDLNESGGLATGPNKNIKLGQLRTAIGLNTPGKPFNWSDPIGKSVVILVSHRADKEDVTKVYEDVKAFRAA